MRFVSIVPIIFCVQTVLAQNRFVDRACEGVDGKSKDAIAGIAGQLYSPNDSIATLSREVRQWVKRRLPGTPDDCAVEIVRDVYAVRDYQHHQEEEAARQAELDKLKPKTIEQQAGHLTIYATPTISTVAFTTIIDGKKKSEKLFLLIQVRITNNSANRKTRYKSWSPKELQISQQASAELIDDAGNDYESIPTHFTQGTVDGAIDVESVYPGESIEDILIFERPVDNCKELTLKLPLANIGMGTGTVDIKIPRAKVVRK